MARANDAPARAAVADMLRRRGMVQKWAQKFLNELAEKVEKGVIDIGDVR